MSRWSFITGVDAAAQDWETDPFTFALMAGTWTPDPSNDVMMADIVANEFAGVGYVRQTMANPSRTIELPATSVAPGFIRFHCDDPAFGAMTGGAQAAYVVCFADTGNDATSPLVCAFTIFYEADGSACTVQVSQSGLLVISSVCSQDFSGGASEGS